MSVRPGSALEAGARFSLRAALEGPAHDGAEAPRGAAAPLGAAPPTQTLNVRQMHRPATAPLQLRPATTPLSLKFGAPTAPADPPAAAGPRLTAANDVMRLSALCDDLGARLKRATAKLETTESALARSTQALAAERQTAQAKLTKTAADLATAQDSMLKLRAELEARPTKETLDQGAFAASVETTLASAEMNALREGLKTEVSQLETTKAALVAERDALHLERDAAHAALAELVATRTEADAGLAEVREALSELELRKDTATAAVAAAEAAVAAAAPPPDLIDLHAPEAALPPQGADLGYCGCDKEAGGGGDGGGTGSGTPGGGGDGGGGASKKARTDAGSSGAGSSPGPSAMDTGSPEEAKKPEAMAEEAPAAAAGGATGDDDGEAAAAVTVAQQDDKQESQSKLQKTRVGGDVGDRQVVEGAAAPTNAELLGLCLVGGAAPYARRALPMALAGHLADDAPVDLGAAQVPALGLGAPAGADNGLGAAVVADLQALLKSFVKTERSVPQVAALG